MAQFGYFSCIGCGRLFKKDGSEDQMFEDHDCDECEEDDPAEVTEMDDFVPIPNADDWESLSSEAKESWLRGMEGGINDTCRIL